MPTENKQLRYYLVIGRLHGDDEDTAIIFHTTDQETAKDEFRGEILDQNDMEEDSPRPGEDSLVYINTVAVSDSKIELV